MNRALVLTMFLVGCGPEQLVPEEPIPAVDQRPVDQQPVALTGFPCDVREVLQTNCATCHAGLTYVTHFNSREDLLATRGTEQLGAEIALRLRPGATAPMPPASVAQQPTLAERQLIDGWVQSGMPAGSCGPLVDE